MSRRLPPARILFVTPSFHTRWEAYSQALVRASGLAWRILVRDGRENWHPLDFLEPALAEDSDYVVHIDEDAFLLDPEQLSRLVAEMSRDPELAAAGVPDGGTPYRHHNPYACNLFFAVFKTAVLRETIARRSDWKSLRFDPAWTRRLRRPPPSVADAALDDFEPYYPLFWLILEQGFQIRYLSSSLVPDCLASQVVVGDAPQPMVLHGWHLRKWFSQDVDPDMGISPAEKYRRIATRMNARFIHRPQLLFHLGCA
ncbi:MAG TPA: hypothetical protein PL011_10740, partial [Kiritimatiellia bacterium]|nr:hypothetical protein [Kiritimatiellia bacterium]